MSREGGSSGHGCIFKTDDQGMNPVILYSFTDTLSGINPEGSLVQGTNKKLYESLSLTTSLLLIQN